MIVALTASFIAYRHLFAQASKPRVNNERPEKVTGQVKRIHPHALKLILQGNSKEAIAYPRKVGFSKRESRAYKAIVRCCTGQTGFMEV